MPLSWPALRAISQSSFARLAVLVPLLPFLIELLEVVFSPIYFAEATARGVEGAVGGNSTYVSDMLTGLGGWATDNRSAVVSFYVGIVFFLIGKAGFQAFAPKAVAREDLLHEMESSLQLARLASDAGNEQLQRFYNDRSIHLHGILDSGARSAFREDEYVRLALSCIFGFAIFLLAWPPVFKFIKIFFFDFLF